MAEWASSRVLSWWPVLLAPLAVGLVLLTRDTPVGAAIRTHDTGPLPPLIPLAAAVAALVGAVWRRNPLLWLLAALGLLFFLREASVPGTDDHLPGMKKGVYVGLLLLAVWAYAWRDRLRAWVRSGRLGPALVAMGGLYALSQLIARGGLKVFSELTDASGQTMRTPMEECCETAGHLLLLGIAMAACITRRRPTGDEAPRTEHRAFPAEAGPIPDNPPAGSDGPRTGAV